MSITRTAASEGRLSAVAAAAWLPHTCFKNGPPRRVGIELELLVHDRRDPSAPTDGAERDRVRHEAARLPTAGRVTVEPGGQLEISSSPHPDLASAVHETSGDLKVLQHLAHTHDLRLVGRGVDDRDVARRVLADERYAQMEHYLDRWAPAGRTMMRRTASVQVNVEASDGSPGEADRRWTLLHAVGPALVAAFANSPGTPGSPWAGWACARMGVWLALDPARTSEPRPLPGESVADAWSRWCLDAPLLLVRRPQGPWTAPPATFREWLHGGRDVVPGRPGPDVDDLAYHLTTLFPPVRARGHLEVRYVDAQPGPWWVVPAAVLWVLATDPDAGARALRACAETSSRDDRWVAAARDGLRDDGLARAACGVLSAAATALAADPTGRAWADPVAAYRERWTARRRSPGDDPPADVTPLPPVPRAGPLPGPSPRRPLPESESS